MLDHILRFSITRRLWVLAIVLAIAAAGFWSYQRLNIDAVPDITNVQVQVNTQAPGYTPLEVEQRITFLVERAIAGLPHVEMQRSLSRYGLSQVTVIFEEGTDLYFARTLVNERLQQLRSQMPAGIEPMLGPMTTGLGEIYFFTVEVNKDARQADGTAYDALALRTLLDWVIKPQLLQVPGITEVNAIGGYEKQFHVLPDPAQLMAYGLSFDDVARALERNNGNRGAGYIERNGEQLLVRMPGQVQGINDLRSVVVANRRGVPITVADIGEVAIGMELRTGAATRDGHETVLATAILLVGANSHNVSHQVARKLESINASLPKGVSVVTAYDRTVLVDKAIGTVQKNLVEGALLVVVVLFLLLGNLRAALLTALVIPLAMLMTISGMVKAGVSANLMSLGALDFGLIVDGAVIIVENCIRRLSMASAGGKPLPLNERLELVFDSTREVIRPALFGVFIITVVYVPILALEGVEGKMFHPMALTVILALAAAMLLCLTFVPAAVALLFRQPVGDHDNRFMRTIHDGYERLLAKALRHRLALLAGSALLVLACLALGTRMGSEFIPSLDEGDLAIMTARIPGTSLSQSLEMQLQIEKALGKVPEVQTAFSRIGTGEIATDPMPPNLADGFIMIKPRAEWPDPGKPKAQLNAEIMSVLESVPGNAYELSQPIQLRFNELISGVRSELAIKIYGDDLDRLLATGNAIARVTRKIQGAVDVNVEQVSGLPMLSIQIRRDAMAHYGLALEDVQSLIAAAIAGREAGQVFEGDARFDVVMRLPEAMRSDVRALEQLPVPLPNGGYVPLSEVAELVVAPQPNQISRENGKRRVVVTANVRERDLGSFVAEVQRTVSQQVKVPPGYWLDYGGTFEQLQSASRRLQILVPITLIVILALLIAATNSVKDSLVIFSGIPFALTGGILALWLRGIPLSISAAVGFIALSGVAVLNGLVMVSFIRDELNRGMAVADAVMSGALTRLRPVLMTALVASLGFLPMALNTGTGAEVQRPLATVVIGGIVSSTLLTLLVLPGFILTAHRRRDHAVKT